MSIVVGSLTHFLTTSDVQLCFTTNNFNYWSKLKELQLGSRPVFIMVMSLHYIFALILKKELVNY